MGGPALLSVSRTLSVLYTPWLMVVQLVVSTAILIDTLRVWLPDASQLGTSATLIPAVLIAMASLVLHELGHAAAGARFRQVPRRIGVSLHRGLIPALFVDVAIRGTRTPAQLATMALSGVIAQLLAASALCVTAHLFPTAAHILVAAAAITVILALLELIPLPGTDGADLIAALR